MAHGKKTKRQKRQLAKKQTGVTVAEFINRVQYGVFAYTNSSYINATFELKVLSSGFIHKSKGHSVSLTIDLARPM